MTGKQQQTILFGVLLGLALIIAAYFFAIKPQLADRSTNIAETQAAEAEAVTLQAAIADLEQKKEALPRAEAQVAELTRKFPNTYEQDQWLRMVLDVAAESGVQVTTISPGAPVEPGVDPALGGVAPTTPTAAPVDPNAAPAADPAAAPAAPVVAAFPIAQSNISLTATGSTAAVSRFLRALENMPRPLLIDAVAFTGADAGASVSITGKTFLSRGLDSPLADAEE